MSPIRPSAPDVCLCPTFPDARCTSSLRASEFEDRDSTELAEVLSDDKAAVSLGWAWEKEYVFFYALIRPMSRNPAALLTSIRDEEPARFSSGSLAATPKLML